MKVCSKCKEPKSLDSFHKRANRPCGVRSQCKTCYKNYPKKMKRREGYMREYDLNKSYGISLAEYDKLFNDQDGKCAICGSKQDCTWKKNLSVDHCHHTGEIRGLLCDTCNRGVGLLKDSPEILQKAINYLTKN